MPSKALRIFSIICHCALVTSLQGEETVPVPRLAFSMDLSHDDRRWIMATAEGNATSVLMEMIPESDTPGEWEELITNVVAFGSSLDSYVNSWRARMSARGVQMTSDQRVEEASRLLRYASVDEVGIWKFTQGPDGVYGISYQFRPAASRKISPSLWQGSVISARLVENPPPVPAPPASDSPPQPKPMPFSPPDQNRH